MSKICKNCKYFEYINNDFDPEWLGNCNNSNFIYTGNGNEFSINGLGYWDIESYNACFAVGEKFGCIHFEQKEVSND